MSPTKLRQFLKGQGLTQVGLAMLLEVDPRTVRRYVNGESEIPMVIEWACLGLAAQKKDKR